MNHPLSELSSLFSDEDSSEEEIDFDQLGGAGPYDTKSYYLKRLKKYDKDLFVFKSKKLTPKGLPSGYPKYCQTVDARQPVAVTTDELERINTSEEVGSGRDSYQNSMTIEGRSDDIHYICPKYWDVSKDLSITPEYIDSLSESERNKLVIPEKAKGKTSQSILQRTGRYWRVDPKLLEIKPDQIQYIKTVVTEESKLLHPEGYGLPCCFNMSKDIKRIVDKGSEERIVEQPKKENLYLKSGSL